MTAFDPKCRVCQHDDHRCPGCGAPLDHSARACPTCIGVEQQEHDRLAHVIETHANESAQELALSGAELIAEHTGRPMGDRDG